MMVRGEPEYVDQVPRLERFRQDHPEIDIMSPQDTRSAFWKAYQDGALLTVQHSLRWFLDNLEAFAAPQP